MLTPAVSSLGAAALPADLITFKALSTNFLFLFALSSALVPFLSSCSLNSSVIWEINERRGSLA